MTEKLGEKKGLLSGVLDPVGNTLESGLKPVGDTVGTVSKPVTGTVGSVTKPVGQGLGLDKKQDIPGTKEEEKKATSYGGNTQTAQNPLGL